MKQRFIELTAGAQRLVSIDHITCVTDQGGGKWLLTIVGTPGVAIDGETAEHVLKILRRYAIPGQPASE
ncbi:MAG TPA: hypothetical protein VNH11_00740 [Pirellulales bacterium]|nr:hypothetical protein [Pirellulales bacterium]